MRLIFSFRDKQIEDRAERLNEEDTTLMRKRLSIGFVSESDGCQRHARNTENFGRTLQITDLTPRAPTIQTRRRDG